MPDQVVAAFVFGKLPTHGDFVVRGLETARRERWDAWLATEIAQAQAAFGEDFARRYEAAPVWRFAIEEEDGWSTGALAASVDSVGRRFPLVAGVTGTAAQDVAAQCENLLYDALCDGWDADRLHSRLMAIDAGATGDADNAPIPGWRTASNAAHAPANVAGNFPARLFVAMLEPIGAIA